MLLIRVSGLFLFADTPTVSLQPHRQLQPLIDGGE